MEGFKGLLQGFVCCKTQEKLLSKLMLGTWLAVIYEKPDSRPELKDTKLEKNGDDDDDDPVTCLLLCVPAPAKAPGVI